MTSHPQSSLFPEIIDTDQAMPKPVNVASVPQRSPFRYPEGKTWFVPTFRKWMVSLRQKPRLLIEPFAGGGITSLTALFENLVDRVVMVELDEGVAAVWQSVVNGDAPWLADRILKFNMTKEAVLAEINAIPRDIKHLAFQAILKNRTFHGGILAEGATFLKHGENGKGIQSRWYPATLAKRFGSSRIFVDSSAVGNHSQQLCYPLVEKSMAYQNCARQEQTLKLRRLSFHKNP